jgi:hypothetical protein
MTSRDLAALAHLERIGKLKAEAPDARERAGLLRSATVRLQDARQSVLSLESRFDLAYNTAHAAALSALRAHGYRSEKPLSGLPSAIWPNMRATSMSRPVS